jgi:hypothetical protein
MLILAGNGRGLPFDYDELERWTRVGYERGMRFRKGNVDGLAAPPFGSRKSLVGILPTRFTAFRPSWR